MFKATTWNMPIAFAVANDWDTYVSIPHDKRTLFFWFEPDSGFLEMSPTEVVFPAPDDGLWIMDDG